MTMTLLERPSPLRGSGVFIDALTRGYHPGLYSAAASGGCLNADA